MKKETNADNGTGSEANTADKNQAATKENGTVNSTLDDETEGEGDGDDFNKELGELLRDVDGEPDDIKYSDDEEDSNIGRYIAFSII